MEREQRMCAKTLMPSDRGLNIDGSQTKSILKKETHYRSGTERKSSQPPHNSTLALEIFLIKTLSILYCAIESKKVIVTTGVNSVLDSLNFEAQTYEAAF